MVVRTAADRDPLSLASTCASTCGASIRCPVTRIQTFDGVGAVAGDAAVHARVARLVRGHGCCSRSAGLAAPQLHRQSADSGYRRSRGAGRQRGAIRRPCSAAGDDTGDRRSGSRPACQCGDRPRHRVHVVRRLVPRSPDLRDRRHDDYRGCARRVPHPGASCGVDRCGRDPAGRVAPRAAAKSKVKYQKAKGKPSLIAAREPNRLRARGVDQQPLDVEAARMSRSHLAGVLK